jgi:hypothetical protein
MNRKTFLSSLLALITAPFLVKSKEKEPDVDAWIKANPELRKIIASKAAYYKRCLEMSGKVTIKWKDQ